MSNATAPGDASSAPRNKVLIVEDSRAFAASIAGQIAPEFEVEIAFSYQQACDILNTRAGEFFVAVTDLNLPDAQNGEPVRLMKVHDIPCIVFTGNFSVTLRDDILALGVCDYVLKRGAHDLAYVAWMVHRLYHNPQVSVLVVDDARSARSVMAELLRTQCYQVTTVASAEQAEQRIAKGEPYHLVIVDLVLESGDGFEVLQRLRQTSDASEMAIIGVSGRATQEQIVRFIKYGGNDFIRKPFEPEEFFCRINNATQNLEYFRQLREVNEQKGVLLGMAAHDMRNPLSNVLTGVSLLKKRNTDASLTRMLDLVTQSANHMLELLNGLLDISSVEASTIKLDLQEMDICPPVRRVIDEMFLWADDKKQRFVLDLPANPVLIQGDPLRMQEVVANLISNAIKYSPLGGVISVSLVPGNAEVTLRIQDQGEGISAQEQGKLFQPFAKLAPRPTAGEHSTGLGLAICKKILDLHGARLRYQAPAAGGSIFEVIFPAPQK